MRREHTQVWHRVRRGREVALLLASLLAVGAAAREASSQEPEQKIGSRVADWWSDNFEVHGFLTTKSYFRSPEFSNPVEVSSWRTELNLEGELRLYEGDNLRLGLYGVVRPIYDAIYEVQSDLWGNDIDEADFGTAPAFPDDPTTGNQLPVALGGPAIPLPTFAGMSGAGKGLPCIVPDCAGPSLEGEFTIVNADTGTFFTGDLTPAVAIDNVVFFGRVTAPVRPRSGGQEYIGGNATGETYEDLRDNFVVWNGGLGAGLGLDGSLGLVGTDPAPGNVGLGSTVTTPLNAYQGALGDRRSFKHGSFDINRTEPQLRFDCTDNAHPLCFLREIYLDAEYGDTFVRVGKQQIVWGKTDAFRLQDKINPIDLGYHNVFPDLEERRIPQLALDVIHSFGDVGPLQDVSLEFAWVFDRFIPDQFGQCGEPYAFTAACEARADAAGHQLFNFALANVHKRRWTFNNTEPGLRLEFRIPEPSIAFSLSAFYMHQDLPVARFSNPYSVTNPNPAVLLFLQGVGQAGTIDALSAASAACPAGCGGLPAPFPGGSSGRWLLGFDPYAHDAFGAPLGALLRANEDLQNAWFMLMNVMPPAGGGCAGLAGSLLGSCAATAGPLALPWSASEVTLEYPRLWSLGASLDYQIPGVDTVLRLEMAADLDRHIQNTALLSQVDKSPVFQAAIGLDRSTFIPFLNRNRTAFLSVQTFFEHIIDYDDGAGSEHGMVPWETTIISTAFMQNYWRNDSVILTSFVAVDWFSEAVIFGPSLRWLYDDHLFFDIGVNLLWGQKQEHNLRDLCADRTLGCLGDPTTWQDGNWQTLNANFALASEHPFFGKESFADKFMRKRDEFWVGVTYQF